MTSENLVPTDLPYGERQHRVAQMRLADVPTETSSQGASPVSATPLPPQQGLPPDFDALTAVSPTPVDELTPVMSEADRLRLVADSTPNHLLAAIIRRVLDKQ